MAIRESVLRLIENIELVDYLRVVTSAGGSRRVSVPNLSKTILESYDGSELGGEFQSVKDAVDGITGDVSNLGTGVQGLADDVEELTEDVVGTGTQISEIQGQLSEMQGQISDILEELSKPRRELLWTNPNFSADFPSQTIPLDLTPFSQVQIDFGTVVTLEKDSGSTYFGRYLWTAAEGNVLASRAVSATNTGVSIGNCNLMGVGNSSAAVTNNTSQMKPARIFGVY